MKNIASTNEIDWQSWLKRWDKMQEGYLPWREYSYKIILDTLSYWMPINFVAIDVACGPGSISSRVLAKFPGAKCVGIDFDPILIELGVNTLGDANGRMTWVESDVRNPNWIKALPLKQCDAIVSSTALHWLAPDELIGLYMQFGALLRPGGIFLNADEMRPAYSRLWPYFHHWSRSRWKQTFSEPDMESWEDFWKEISNEPILASKYEIHKKLYNTQHCASELWGASFPLHASMLQSAGFAAVETLWQDGIERIVMAVR